MINNSQILLNLSFAYFETADYYVRTDRGHYLTKEEAIRRLEEVEEAGLVHCAFQVEGKDYTTFICNCCGCSCSGLRQINRLDANPMSHSNFRAKVEEDKCVACGDCVEICPMNAATLGTNFAGADEEQTPYYKKAQSHWYKKEDIRDDFINERNLVSNFGTAPCKVACPAHIAVQGYIQKASEGNYLDALKIIKKDNPLPAICGRICPHPCEAACTRNTLDLANRGKDTGLTRKVIVVGGGNVAIDVARTAIRDGAESVSMYCLESAEEMPAAADEQIEAKAEGITIHNGWGPMTILNKNGLATGIRFKKCTSVLDSNGHFAPQYDETVTEDVEGAAILLAIGQRINWGSLLEGEHVDIERGNRVLIDPITYQTSAEDIFAGGDVVTEPKFAIDAIAMGKQGAISISRMLRGLNLKDGRNATYKGFNINAVTMPLSSVDTTPRQFAPEVDHAKAIDSFNDLREGLTEEQIKKESGRCLHCGRSVIDMDKCIGCGVCIHRCEFDAIHLTRVDDTQFAETMGVWYRRAATNAAKRGLNIAVTAAKDAVQKRKK